MALIPLISIVLLYFITAYVKPILQKRIKWNICAICVAVSLTWILLIILFLSGLEIDRLYIGILMGMSITGMMYKLEIVYREFKLKHFWFTRLVIIIGGLYFIALLLHEQLSEALVVAIVAFLLIIIVSCLAQGTTHEDAVRTANIDEKKKSFLNKLDNCC